MRRLTRAGLVLTALTAAAACGEGGSDDGDRPGPADSAATRTMDSTAGGAVAADTVAAPETAADPDVPEYGVIRAQVCDTLTNSFDCARAIEGRRIGEAGDAWRTGDTLRLALAGGDTIRFVDQPGDHADVVYYSYQMRWPRAGFFLLQKQYYEGAGFLLVNDSTGAETHLPDWPLRSPDGRRFAVLSLDLVAGYGPNTLQIWEIEEGVPTRQWETEPGQWGPTDGRWLGPTRLRIIQHGYCGELGGEGRSMCDRPAEVYLSGGYWHVEPGSAEPEPAGSRRREPDPDTDSAGGAP